MLIVFLAWWLKNWKLYKGDQKIAIHYSTLYFSWLFNSNILISTMFFLESFSGIFITVSPCLTFFFILPHWSLKLLCEFTCLHSNSSFQFHLFHHHRVQYIIFQIQSLYPSVKFLLRNLLLKHCFMLFYYTVVYWYSEVVIIPPIWDPSVPSEDLFTRKQSS